jgi:hypothetical protein
MAEASEGGGQGSGGLDTALGYFALECRCPAMGGEVCTREMDGGGEVFKVLGVRDGRSGGGIPLELVGQSRFAPDELEDGGVPCSKDFLEGRSEHSGGAGEENPGRWGSRIDGTDVAFLLMNTIVPNREAGLAGRKSFLIWTII